MGAVTSGRVVRNRETPVVVSKEVSTVGKRRGVGAIVEVISGRANHGLMPSSLGGVGAILRYNPSHPIGVGGGRMWTSMPRSESYIM